jgi:glyoxylase-like metal-dependent hydrolase (beta-lactamase superfamily II)
VKTTPHGSNLIQITQWPTLFPINAYLVREDDGFTLIDTGYVANAKTILKAAHALGAPIRRIALTHVHGDHIGSLMALHEALPKAEILIPERDAQILAGDRSPRPGEPADAKLRGSYKTLDIQPTRLLQPGDLVGSLTVVAAPGHTPGQVAYLDTRDRSLIAGDAFHTRGGITVSGVLNLRFPFPAFSTWHKPTAIATADALRNLKPSRLAVGHGDPIDAPDSAMEAAIAAASKR